MARDTRTSLILGYAATLFAVGLLFLIAPSSGAAIFALPAKAGETLRFINLLGFRDLGLSAGLAVLALQADRRAVGLLLGASAIIPLYDVGFILSQAGFRAGPLALHAGSGACLAGLSAWSLREP